jgi:hypothetical protein
MDRFSYIDYKKKVKTPWNAQKQSIFKDITAQNDRNGLPSPNIPLPHCHCHSLSHCHTQFRAFFSISHLSPLKMTAMTRPGHTRHCHIATATLSATTTTYRHCQSRHPATTTPSATATQPLPPKILDFQLITTQNDRKDLSNPYPPLPTSHCHSLCHYHHLPTLSKPPPSHNHSISHCHPATATQNSRFSTYHHSKWPQWPQQSIPATATLPLPLYQPLPPPTDAVKAATQPHPRQPRPRRGQRSLNRQHKHPHAAVDHTGCFIREFMGKFGGKFGDIPN